MKLILILAALIMSVGLGSVSAQIKMPAPSPYQEIMQRVGVTDVTVAYSRPGMKDRKIFGDLVPFDQLWRTGANSATKITLDGPVTFGSVKLEKGEYALFTIPGKSEWTVIFNTDTKANTTSYDQKKDVGRIKVKSLKSAMKYETFTVDFTNLSDSSATMRILWDQTYVELPITTMVDASVMAQIEEQVINGKPEDEYAYFQAANYYFKTERDLDMAYQWVEKSQMKEKTYWKMHLQAKILEKQNKKEEAIKMAEQSHAMAKEADNPDYLKMNEELIARCKK